MNRFLPLLPRARRTRSLTIAVIGIAILAGCTDASFLPARIRAVRTVVDDAERNGARTCAPRELAIAKSELEFAAFDLDEGRPASASRHLDEADPNARAAAILSPPDRCQLPRGDNPRCPSNAAAPAEGLDAAIVGCDIVSARAPGDE